MANQAKPQDFETSGVIRWNLCDASRDVGGFRFTCFDKADGVDTWSCTGGEHRNGLVIVCTCECHNRAAVQTMSFTIDSDKRAKPR